MIDMAGKDKFRKDLPLLPKLDHFDQVTHLGIIRDAESNPAQDALKSICKILKTNLIPHPEKNKWIIKTEKLSVGIFIMPDNQNSGMLEDLCLQSIQEQPITHCLEQFKNCFYKTFSNNEQHTFNESKFKVQSYLATRVPIENSLGIGALRKHWDFSHACFGKIKSFLLELFGN
jgi:hypothetical protein